MVTQKYTTLTLPISNTEALGRAVDLLRQGLLVAFPTDTVYGLGCDPWQPAAIERLFQTKRRPMEMAIPILVASLSVTQLVAQDQSATFEALARRFWPGELTLIVPRRERVPDILCAGGPTIAVRMPNHRELLTLLEEMGGALAVTSANISGRPSPCTAEEVLADFIGNIPLILDGGRCSGGVASTIIDCVAQPPVLLRAGNLSLDELQSVVPGIVQKTQAAC
jgi:L-threonylcarbamoyladenylate synthase